MFRTNVMMALAAACSLSLPAMAEQADREKPMNITADHCDFDQKTMKSICTSNVVVVRFKPNGKLDGRFGQDADGTPDGVVNLSLGDGNDTGRAVALQADGKIVVAADRVNGNSTDIALVRLLGR